MDPVDAAQAYRMAVMAQNKSKAPPRPWMWTLSNNPCWEGGGAGENENPDWGIAHSRVCFPGAPLLPYDTHTHTHNTRKRFKTIVSCLFSSTMGPRLREKIVSALQVRDAILDV